MLISRSGGEHVVEFDLIDAPAISVEEVTQLPGIVTARFQEEKYSLSVSEPHIALPSLMNYLQTRSFRLASLTTRHATLEDVFVNLTGRHLRDGN